MIQELTLSTALDKIRNADDPFTFSRWGDGEWRAVLKTKDTMNCDHHKFFPQMGAELADVLKRNPEYMLGMQNFSWRHYGSRITKFLADNKVEGLQWYNSDVFHYGAIYGHMQDILDAVNSRKVLIVGPSHLKSLPDHGLNYWKYVPVPGRNCYAHLDNIYKGILAKIDGKKERLLISLSASMPAEILCDKLYDRFGDLHTIIDFGSLWDPLVGVRSRSYMKDPKFKI